MNGVTSQTDFLFNHLKDTKISFIVLLIIVIAIYIGIFFLLGNSNSDSTSYIQKIFIIILEVVLWSLLIFIIYINIKNFNDNNNNKYTDIEMKLTNLFNMKLAELDVSAKTTHDIPDSHDNPDSSDNCTSDSANSEVFHIANNKYTYQEAKDICEKYNSRLATYEEIENAYNQGANWCSYGWSKDQLALFPVQKEVYNELKKIPGHENDCGRPGINGGYIKNQDIKFGINCYGIKPNAKEKDKVYMHAINHSPALKETNNKDAQNNLNKYIVAPFNKIKWSNIN